MMRQAGEMGILQIHLSGGEPTARKDLEDIVSAASDAGLYSNLITAAVTLKRDRLEDLQSAASITSRSRSRTSIPRTPRRSAPIPAPRRRSSTSPAG